MVAAILAREASGSNGTRWVRGNFQDPLSLRNRCSPVPGLLEQICFHNSQFLGSHHVGEERQDGLALSMFAYPSPLRWPWVVEDAAGELELCRQILPLLPL